MGLPKIKLSRENFILVSILVIALAIPFTVVLLGIRQELRKRAEGINGSILINNGAETTNSRDVTLTLTAPAQSRDSLTGAGHNLFEISQAYAQLPEGKTCNDICETEGYLGGTCRNMNKGGCQEGEESKVSGQSIGAEATDCVLFEICCCKRPCEPSAPPDLVVESVYHSGNTIKALIKNRGGGGGGATTWIWVELWVDGKKVAGAYGDVPACGTVEWYTGKEVIFDNYFFAAGNEVKVCADTTNRISETNEDNNCLEVDICRECDQQCHEGTANDECCPGFLCTRNATTGGQFRCRNADCFDDPSCVCANLTPTPTPVEPTPTPPSVIVEQMMISNFEDFSGAVLETFAATKSWTLTEGDVLKTVWAKFGFSDGTWTTPVFDTITLSTTGPTPTPTTPPGTPTPTIPPGTPTPTPTPPPSGYLKLDLLKVWFWKQEKALGRGHEGVVILALKQEENVVLEKAVQLDGNGEARDVELPGVETGTYNAFIYEPGYLTKKLASVSIEESGNTLDFTKNDAEYFLVGDFNGDQEVNILDFSIFVKSYGKSGEEE